MASIPLSPIENILVQIYDEFDRDSGGAIRCCVRGVIEEAPLRAAISHLQKHHAKLQACVVMRNGRRFFEVPPRVNPIPLTLVDAGQGPAAWQAEMYRAISTPMDVSTGPMAAVRVLQDRAGGRSEIHFIVHHAIADGFSVFRIMDELLALYALAEAGAAMPEQATRPLITAARAKVTASLRTRLALALKIVKQRRGSRRCNWTTMPDGRGTAPESCLEYAMLSREETEVLARRARNEKTSMLGAHFAAAACALSDLMPGEDLRIRCRVPLNIRSSLIGRPARVTDDDIGCFVGAFEGSYETGPAPSFWDLARRLRSDLKTFVKGSGPQVSYNLIRFARASAFRKVKKKRVTMALNFLGEMDLRERYGSLEVESAMIMAKNVHLGPSFGILGVIVNGRYGVAVCATDIPVDFFKRYFDAVLARLRAAAQSQP